MNPTSEPSSRPFAPFVPEASTLPELTFRAVFLGTAMAIVLGTANAYLGMRAGLTVAATFPAAVVAMAALRILGGSVLEENMARTTASVGEALVAGAIFTIPAFVITGVWDELQYWESTAIMLVGGVLGVLFIIVLRRTLVVEAELPFPESVAAAELVKAGQRGRQTGAAYVFKAMGMAAAWELVKNTNGLKLVSDSATTFVSLGRSTIEMLGQQVSYVGGFLLQSPGASPALVGVGFIVGPQIAATLFAGAVLGWLLLVPLGLFLNPALAAQVTGDAGFIELSEEVWNRQVRPLAVGTMIVAAFYTLYRLRTSLFQGIGRALGDLQTAPAGGAGRQDIDLGFRKVGLAIGALAVPLFGLYWYFSGSFGGAILLTVLMVILGFLFAAVAGYLVGVLGSSNNPISGLTLSTLLIAAIVMVGIGVTGSSGILGVLAVAGVVCCACGIAGDMLQDLKVGHILGGTPWKMQIGELIGVTVAAMVLIYPMILMDRVYEIGSRRAAGAAGRPDGAHVGGHRRWRDGVAAGHRRDGAGRRPDPHQCAVADADRGRHVPAARLDGRDLRRRARALVAVPLARPAAGDRGAAHAGHQHRRAAVVRLHRRRGPDGGPAGVHGRGQRGAAVAGLPADRRQRARGRADLHRALLRAGQGATERHGRRAGRRGAGLRPAGGGA